MPHGRFGGGKFIALPGDPVPCAFASRSNTPKNFIIFDKCINHTNPTVTLAEPLKSLPSTTFPGKHMHGIKTEAIRDIKQNGCSLSIPTYGAGAFFSSSVDTSPNQHEKPLTTKWQIPECRGDIQRNAQGDGSLVSFIREGVQQLPKRRDLGCTAVR